MFFDRLRIRTKLTLLAGIPVLGALLLSTMVIQSARSSAKTAEAVGSVEDLAELSDRMRNVVSSLQKERAHTAWATGQKIPVAEATQSERLSTDTSLERLYQFVDARDKSKLPPRLARELSRARSQLKALAAFRSELTKGEVTLDRQLDFYEAPAVSLVGATAALTELSNDGSLLRGISSLASTMEVKERLSLEHALLAHVFALHEYPPGAFRRLVSLNTEEQVFTKSIGRQASEEHLRTFQKALATDSAKAAGELKAQTLDSTDDEVKLDAKKWYDAQATLIGDLGDIERDLGGQVRRAATAKIEEARHAVRVSTGLTVAVLFVSLVLALLIARGVSKSVASLSAAAEKVRRDQDFDVRAPKLTSDEIGALTDAFNEMLAGIQDRDRELELHRADLEKLVENRTQELSRRNAAMRLVLDNVAQGLATASTDGTLSKERSAAFDRWFGPPEEGAPFSQHLAGEDRNMSDSIRVAFNQILDDFMPLEVTLDMMPKRLERGARSFSLEYTPLMQEEKLEGLLLMITDVTERVHAERLEATQREQVRTFQRVLNDRAGFIEYFNDARTLVGQIRDDQFANDVERRRVVHTLKGNSSLFEVETVVTAAHDLEQAFDDSRPEDIRAYREVLVSTWDAFAARTVPLLGEDIGDRVELNKTELWGLLEALRRGASTGELEAKIARLAFEPMHARFKRISVQLSGLAKRLGKAEPLVVIKDGDARLPVSRFAPLWTAFSHLVRNIVDHGFDDENSRVSSGKPAKVRVELAAQELPTGITVTVSDDGRGIDWERVRQKAKDRGVAHTTRSDLVAALLSSGFSTADQVTSTSGRGVGLSAVAAAVAGLGGKFQIESEWGKGTRFTMSFGRLDVKLEADAPRLSMRPLSTAPHRSVSNLPHLADPEHVVIPAHPRLPHPKGQS